MKGANPPVERTSSCVAGRHRRGMSLCGMSLNASMPQVHFDILQKNIKYLEVILLPALNEFLRFVGSNRRI
jgi:hypothetical protein